MIFTGFRDTDQDCLFPTVQLTIRANGDQSEEEEVVEDEDKEEEEEAAVELDNDDCSFKRRSFTRFVEGFGRICGLKGKNKVKWLLKS